MTVYVVEENRVVPMDERCIFAVDFSNPHNQKMMNSADEIITTVAFAAYSTREAAEKRVALEKLGDLEDEFFYTINELEIEGN
jgi:hypothetical protein